MQTERRSATRARCLYGGFIAFNDGKTTMDCQVRNLSPEGALLSFTADALVPEEFSLQVAHLGRPVSARILWRNGERRGVSFSEIGAGRRKPAPLDLAGRLKAYIPPSDTLRAREA